VPSYDAILVPGGGLHSTGEVQPWVKRRLDRAIERAHECEYFITLSRGTTHRPPPLNERGEPTLESEAGADYLLRRGIAETRVLVESWSLDTIGNAYFSRVAHAEPMRMRRLLIITSEFHIARTEAIFNWIYGLPGGDFQLEYDNVENVGLSPDVLAERREKERGSLAELRQIIPGIQTLKALHGWLFFEHGAYRARKSRPDTSVAIDSY